MDNPNLILVDERPQRADAIKNHILLLDTARRLFAEQGVDAVSMSAIAEAAGVGKGTLYRHFNSKVELALALLDQEQRELQERTLLRLRTQPRPLENLRWFVGEVLAFVERNRQFLCVSGAATTELELPAHRWWRQTIRGLFEMLHIPGDLDYKADVVYALLSIQVINFQRDSLGYDHDRIYAGLMDIIDQFTR